jgi:uncharacterized membrane protein
VTFWRVMAAFDVALLVTWVAFVLLSDSVVGRAIALSFAIVNALHLPRDLRKARA